MKKFFKKTVFVFLSLILVLTILPFSAFAAEDGFAKEIGTETPEIFCTYKTYKNGVIGNEVDGNNLSAGYYAVTFNIKGMSTLARLNLGVTVNNDFALLGIWKDSTFVDTENPISSLATDYSSITPVVSVNSSNIIAAFASSEENYTTISSDGTAIVTVGMKVLQNCDATSIFDINTSPNVTFAQPYYSINGVSLDDYDCYALLDDASNYDGNTYGMTLDVSPNVEINGYNFSGTVYIMTDLNGSAGTGVPNITVSIGDYTTVTGSDGTFTISGVANGTYTVSVSGETTIDRTFIVTINNEDVVKNTTICTMDFNKDGVVNTLDLSEFFKHYGFNVNLSNKSVYADVNGDGIVNTLDLASFLAFNKLSAIYGNMDN